MTRKFVELVRKRRVKEGSSSSGASVLGRVELWALRRSRSTRALMTLRLCRVFGTIPSSSVACPFCCFFDLPREKRRWRNPIAVAVESNKNKYHRGEHIPSCFPRRCRKRHEKRQIQTWRSVGVDVNILWWHWRRNAMASRQRTSSSGPVPDPWTAVLYRSLERDELR